MDVVASSIAIVTFTLQSAKALYELLEGFKHASVQVSQLLSATKALQQILQQVSDLSIQGIQQGFKESSAGQHLQLQLYRCSTDLGTIQNRLEKLQIAEREGRLRKASQRIRIIGKDKAIGRMWNLVQNHVIILGVQLTVVNSCNDFARDERIVRSNDAFNTAFNVIMSQHSEQESQKNKANFHLASRFDRLESLLQQTTLHGSNEQRMEELQIQRQNRELEGCHCHDADARERVLEGQLPRMQEIQSVGFTVSRAIDRLCHLQSKNANLSILGLGRAVLQDLETILGIILRAQDIRVSAKNGKRELKYEDSLITSGQWPKLELQNTNQVKRIQGIFQGSQSIRLNEIKAPFQNMSAIERRMRPRAMASNYEMDGAIIALTSLIWQHNIKEDTCEEEIGQSDCQSVLEIYTGSICILPDVTRHRTKVSATFFQRVTSEGFSVILPTLSHSRIVPNNSDVFRATMDGNLKSLVEMIDKGEASIFDCDVIGRSLLNLAIYHSRPEICKFLIDHGADVNSLEKRFGELNFEPFLYPPLVTLVRESELDAIHLDRFLECTRLLLEAGADPTMDICDAMGFSWSSPITHYVTGTTEIMRIYLNLGGPYLDLMHRNWYGRDVMLQMLTGISYAYQTNVPEKVALLLNRGADVTVRDRSGNGCLHTLLRFFNPGRCNTDGLIQTMIILINAGADLFAVNRNGESVSDIAFRRNLEYNLEEALINCGKDAEKVLEPRYGALGLGSAL